MSRKEDQASNTKTWKKAKKKALDAKGLWVQGLKSIKDFNTDTPATDG